MAKIYPERPPQSIIDDPSRRAELHVFEALKDLPDKYRVFYSMHWQGYQKQNGVYEGEADFIIAHPDLGVLILEVKGGGIQYDAENDQWYSQSRDGETHKIKDPIDQGRRNHYEIRNKLEQLPSWPQRKFNIWHAICFPDVYLKSGQSFKPDLPREIIIDANDLNDITSTIKRVFIHCFGENIKDGAPGLDRMQIIEGLLANSFEFSSPLGIELESEDRQLIQLTEQQYIALSLLGERKRVAIAGCAGSGKTMLATRKAQQFSDLGMSVLLLCFNKALSEDLRKKLPDTIEVYTFHDLCRVAVKQAGFTLQYTKEMGDLYDVVLPNALLKVTDEIGPVYDVIIVDEGQDFKENYWIALYPLLKEEGYLYIFFDDNQNLFGGTNTFGGLITESPFRLTQNCRNTKSIHRLVTKFHNNPASLLCSEPEGREPEVIQYNGEEELLRLLQKMLHHLVIEEYIDNEDIVILTPHGENNTRLIPGLKLGPFILTNQSPDQRSKIQATSVYKFKGLEKKVVILAEIDNHTNYNRDMVMYVGCSRARVHLIILSDEKTPNQISDRINPYK